MASESERERLAGHALMSDESFRRWLLDDPIAAAKSLGIELSTAEARAIQSADKGMLEEAADLVYKLAAGPRMMGGW
ncbi:MAG: Os1348 family NHLP clan protein [Caldilineales bacterium]|nr:Os1348 family NHLP clan protein [Caldilineales bacterium]MCW5860051.1 hypothetical protein [Caldilineales bacterium]